MHSIHLKILSGILPFCSGLNGLPIFVDYSRNDAFSCTYLCNDPAPVNFVNVQNNLQISTCAKGEFDVYSTEISTLCRRVFLFEKASVYTEIYN